MLLLLFSVQLAFTLNVHSFFSFLYHDDPILFPHLHSFLIATGPIFIIKLGATLNKDFIMT